MQLGTVALLAAAFGLYAASHDPCTKTVYTSGVSIDSVTSYDIVDLGTTGLGVVATGVNSSGTVTGFAFMDRQIWRGVCWEGGKLRDLGTLGGSSSLADGLNDRGEIVGQSEISAGEIGGFLFKNGKMGRLPSMGSEFSLALAINSSGEIAGAIAASKDGQEACLWRNGRLNRLGTPRGYLASAATAIAEDGLVAGLGYSAEERWRAFEWRNGEPRELGPLGGDHSVALAAGGDGLVGGMSTVKPGDDDVADACTWSNGKVRGLGRLPGASWAQVNAIGKRGQIVGSSGVG